MSGAARPVSARAGGASGDPFAVLGLTPRADLTNDDVRAAWRRVAAVTHPDLADGGDPARFADAAAAYTELRSQFGRGEARAALAEDTGATVGRERPTLRARGRLGAPDAWISAIRRMSRSLTVRLAFRVLIAATGAAVGWLAAGGGPAGPALATGAGTWLLLSARRDLVSSRRDFVPADTRYHELWLRETGIPGVTMTSSHEKSPQGRHPGSGPVAARRAGSADHADHDPT